jgi:hypothetical protein
MNISSLETTDHPDHFQLSKFSSTSFSTVTLSNKGIEELFLTVISHAFSVSSFVSVLGVTVSITL